MKSKFAAAFATALAAVWAGGAAAETRGMSAHVHGHGSLSVAWEGDRIALSFKAPGADIVGFEHPAESEADKAAIAAALAQLARPQELFRFPEAAGCAATEVAAELETEDEHDEHDDEHAEHADEHDDAHKDEHEHKDEHAEHEDEHKDEHADEHAEHAGEDEEHHTEFHAEYMLACAAPAAADRIEFPYFELFPNALELEVSAVTGKGAHVFEIARDDPVLDLAGRL